MCIQNSPWTEIIATNIQIKIKHYCKWIKSDSKAIYNIKK